MHLLPRATRPWLLLSATAALLAALSGCHAGTTAPGATASGTAATSDTVPTYYAETIAMHPPAYDSPLGVSIRSTMDGGEVAALSPPSPYQSIGFVAGTGKPGLWIVGAQRWHPVKYDNSAQPAKLYLLNLGSTLIDGQPINIPSLTPLPVAPLPAGQLIDGTAAGSSVRQLAAAALSPDGKRLALVITQGDTYQVSVYPVTGSVAVRTWSGQVTPKVTPFDWGFSLTWLSDDKTLAVGARPGTRWSIAPPRYAT